MGMTRIWFEETRAWLKTREWDSLDGGCIYPILLDIYMQDFARLGTMGCTMFVTMCQWTHVWCDDTWMGSAGLDII
jgi:hypothetical protein